MKSLGTFVGVLVAIGAFAASAPLGCGVNTEGTAADDSTGHDSGLGAGGSAGGEAGSGGLLGDGSAGAGGKGGASGGGAGGGGAGSGGNGGDSGVAGSGGDSGVAGSGGDGGVAGSGGSAGDGGVAGSGGSAGDGGVAGSGGDSGVAGGGGSAGAGGGVDAGAEDCLNGIDDDGDGAVDCADSDCVQTGFACTDPAPSGWLGYYWMHESSFPNASPEPCPGGTAPTTYFEEPNAADCNACGCGAQTGASCNPPGLTCYSSNKCGGQGSDWTGDVPADGSCHKPSLFSTQLSCKLTSAASPKSAGACPPSGGDLKAPSKWKTQADVCGEPLSGGGGCSGGGVCVPKGTSSYASVCITKSGQTACPTGWTSPAKTLYSGGTDSRACSACSCAPGDVTCTGGSYTLFDQNDCTEGATVVSSSTCVDASGLLDWGSWSVNAQPAQATGAGCKASGGQPSGSVQGTGAVTFCCK